MPQTAPENATKDTPTRPRFARGAVLNLLGDGLPLIAGIVAIHILVPSLKDSQFAVLSLAWTTMAIFNLLDLGLGRALTRAVAQSLVHHRGVPVAELRSGLLMLLLVGLIAGALMVTGAPMLTRWLEVPEELATSFTSVLRLLAISLPFVVLTSGLRGILEGVGWFGAASAARSFTSVATYLVPVLLLPVTKNLPTIVAAVVLVRFAGAVLHAWACFLALGKLPKAAPAATTANGFAKDILAFGGWVTAGNLASSAAFYVDRLLLTRFTSLEAAAYFGTPCDMIIRLLFIPAAVGSVLFPTLSACVPSSRNLPGQKGPSETAENAGAVVRRAGRLLLAVLFPVALALGVLAPEIVSLWLGPSWVPRSAPALQILAAVLMVGGMSQPAYTLVQASGRPRWTAWAHLAELPVHVAVLFWVLPRWGVIGATWALALRILLEHATWTVMSSCVIPSATSILWRISAGAVLGAGSILLTSALVLSLYFRLAVVALAAAFCTAFVLHELWRDGVLTKLRGEHVRTTRDERVTQVIAGDGERSIEP